VTERLSTLLHEEATALDVPAPTAPVVLSRGRSLRRRQRAVRGVAAAAVLAVVGTGVATALTVRGGDTGRDSLPAGAGYESTGAFSVGRDLYVGSHTLRWDEPIRSLYYTSAGVVVRSGDDDFALVTPSGERRSLDIEAGDRTIGVEPDSSHLAYAERSGKDTWEIVVVDVLTNEELARTEVGGTFTWGGWEAPPVAIDGHAVWVHFDDGWTEVTWPEVVVSVFSDTRDVYEVANGHYADPDPRRRGVWTIKQMANRAPVGRVRLDEGWYSFFSPDGNHLRAFADDVRGDERVTTRLYDVRTGESRDVPDAADAMGWTPDGHTLEVFTDRVRICEPIAGRCRTYDGDFSGGTVHVGDASYSS
jgi:hypothetical protein